MNFDCDVIVVGAGPTGLTAANLLGRMGVRTMLIERNAGTVNEPRAVSIDDEALRTMQAAGVLDAVLQDVALDYGSHRYFGIDADTPVYKVHPSTREYGFPRRSAFVQPVLEATLRRTLERHAHVACCFDTRCTALTETEDGVQLSVQGADGRERTLRARYVVGADGARSMVREAIGATLQGTTYGERWLIVDLEGTRDRFRETRSYSDPERPTVNLPGPDGRRRFEFMLHAHEREEDMRDEGFVRKLLERFGPDRDAHIVRRQVYTFHARVADRWQTQRVFLCGDAAHLSPPFAGQGVNSAFRDVHNLSWKIASVLRGEMGPALLATYQAEREPHARALIQLAVDNGKLLLVKPGLRTRLLHLGYRLAVLLPPVVAYFEQMKKKPKARYAQGFIVADSASPQVGRLAPQPQLETLDRRLHRMDELTGPGFALLVLGIDAQAAAAELARADWGLQQLQPLAIVPRSYNLDREIWTASAGRDVSDAFGAGASTRVLLLRPDRYVAFDAIYEGQPEHLASQVRALVRQHSALPAQTALPPRSAAPHALPSHG